MRRKTPGVPSGIYRHLLMVLAFLALTVSGGIPPAESGEIRLGMSAAFSGPSQDLGCKLYWGSMAYLHHINEQGGINGTTIKLLTLDDGYNPDPTIANTIRFVDQNDVFCLFNYVGTPTVTRMLPLMTRYQDRPLYLLFPFTGAHPLREPPYDHLVFDFRTSYQAEVRALIDLFVSKGCSRFAILYQADAYGRSGWQSVKEGLAQHGLALRSQTSYPRGRCFGDSFNAQVRIIKACRPDVIISIAASEAAAGFIRDARDNGIDAPIANISFVDPNTIITLLETIGRERDRDYFPGLINSQVVPFFADPSLPAGRQFLRLIRSCKEIQGKTECMTSIKHFKQPGPISFEGFLNAKILVKLLESMGPDPQPEDLPGAFKQLSGADIGIGHPLHINPEQCQVENRVHFITFDNATMVPVDPTRFQAHIP
ncbi:ABC transporter substrate-binding protein [Desulfoplanes sp.]